MQGKEKGQSESNAKPAVLSGARSTQSLQSSERCWELRDLQGITWDSLAKAHSHPGQKTEPGKGPRVLLQHCSDPQSATWESIPCLPL